MNVNILATVGPNGDPAELDVDPTRVRIERFGPLSNLLTGVSAVVATVEGARSWLLCRADCRWCYYLKELISSSTHDRLLPLMPGSFCFLNKQPQPRSDPQVSMLNEQPQPRSDPH